MISQKVEKTMKNLNRNNIAANFVEKKENVVDIIKGILKNGQTVAAGGSMSLFECRVIELLRNGNYDFADRYKEGLTADEIEKINMKARNADVYFCSANAITESGEIYNVDGRSNRVSAICYGPKKIVMVVSVNKIVRDLDAAILRVKSIAAPRNCVRLNCDTYCSKKGYCVSLNNKNSQMTDGCDSKDRICCNYLVSSRQRENDRIEVIFVGEDCGF